MQYVFCALVENQMFQSARELYPPNEQAQTIYKIIYIYKLYKKLQ